MGEIEKKLMSKELEPTLEALAAIESGVHGKGRCEKSYKDEIFEVCVRRARELDASNQGKGE